MCLRFSFVVQLNGCLVVLIHDDVIMEKDGSNGLSRLLTHMADYVLQVRGLQSGATHGVDGQVRDFPIASLFIQRITDPVLD